ncbi:MAG: histidine kinase [Antricoccus sp.]
MNSSFRAPADTAERYGNRVKKVRWDQFAISLLISVVLVVLLMVETIHPSQPALGGWHVIVAWPIALFMVAALLRTRFLAADGSRRSQLTFNILTVFASSLMLIALPSDNLIWVPFCGAAFAAQAALDMWLRAVLLLLPLGSVIGVTTWLGSDSVTIVLNGSICVGVFALVRVREQQRETEELARTQREVIARERARAETFAPHRTVAADLHDVLAHTLSGLIVTLQGATLAVRQQNASTDLTERLATATALARDGLREARDAVENLHPDVVARDHDLAAWLAQTVTRLQQVAGLRIEVRGSATDIPAEWRDMARSVLMESLTNSMKHAIGVPVIVRFITGSDLGLDVLSAGDVASFTDVDHPSGGHGLGGLAARVAVRGGTFSYGRQATGFIVSMRCPIEETA